MVNSDSYSVSVTFGKAVYEAHQRTCTHTFETLEQLKTSQASTDTINFYKNMVRPNIKKLTGPCSAVSNMSGYRCVSDCRSRGSEFDPGPVPYFGGDRS